MPFMLATAPRQHAAGQITQACPVLDEENRLAVPALIGTGAGHGTWASSSVADSTTLTVAPSPFRVDLDAAVNPVTTP